jgi:hypothetical protein
MTALSSKAQSKIVYCYSKGCCCAAGYSGEVTTVEQYGKGSSTKYLMRGMERVATVPKSDLAMSKVDGATW